MESQRGVAGHDVPENLPAMNLTRQHAIVEAIHSDPAVEKSRLVGPGKGTP
jgi:hypothetical protein